MGVKSTKTITRQEAEDKYVTLYKKRHQPDNIIRAQAVVMNDEYLEKVLEQMNDRANDGEGYEDYIIDNYEYRL